MPDDLTVTEQDRARDLRWDLDVALSQDYGTGLADDAWPAAIRRALAAEEDLQRVRVLLASSQELLIAANEENKELHRKLQLMADRIGAQSELLSKRAEGGGP